MTFVSESSTFGANTLTRDPATGFRWLDLTASLGYSYSTLTPELAAGGKFAGYRRATPDEVTALWKHASINVDLSDFATENFLPVTNLMHLLGITGLKQGNRDNVHFFDYAQGQVETTDATSTLFAGLSADPYWAMDGRASFGTTPRDWGRATSPELG